MYDSNSKGISYTAGFFILIGFTIAALLAASLISIPIWTGMTGRSITEMEENLTNPAYSNAIKIIQTITTIIGFFLPAIFTAMLLNRKPMKLLGFTGRITRNQWGLVFLIVISSLFVSGALAYLNELIPLSEKLRIRFDKLEKEYNDQVQVIIGLNNVTEYIIALILMAFLPALCEEALFRGGLQNLLTRSTKKPWLSIIIVSIIFSIVHFSFYGFLPRFFLGIMLGLLYHLSGRLWLSILAHFLNNAAAVSVIYIYTLQGKSIKEAIAESDGSWWGILALPIVIILFIRLYHFSKKEKDEVQAFVPPNNSGELFF
jgi:membrane protease YdiL (CAAX protease family)